MCASVEGLPLWQAESYSRVKRGVQPRACNIDLTVAAIHKSLMATLKSVFLHYSPLALNTIKEEIFIAVPYIILFIYHHYISRHKRERGFAYKIYMLLM